MFALCRYCLKFSYAEQRKLIFTCAALCWRGTGYGRVSVCLSQAVVGACSETDKQLQLIIRMQAFFH